MRAHPPKPSPIIPPRILLTLPLRVYLTRPWMPHQTSSIAPQNEPAATTSQLPNPPSGPTRPGRGPAPPHQQAGTPLHRPNQPRLPLHLGLLHPQLSRHDHGNARHGLDGPGNHRLRLLGGRRCRTPGRGPGPLRHRRGRHRRPLQPAHDPSRRPAGAGRPIPPAGHPSPVQQHRAVAYHGLHPPSRHAHGYRPALRRGPHLRHRRSPAHPERRCHHPRRLQHRPHPRLHPRRLPDRPVGTRLLLRRNDHRDAPRPNSHPLHLHQTTTRPLRRWHLEERPRGPRLRLPLPLHQDPPPIQLRGGTLRLLLLRHAPRHCPGSP